MIDLWAVTASAAELDQAHRNRLAGEMRQWIAGGDNAIVLETCHRVELYGVGPIPRLGGARTHVGRSAISHLLRVAAGLESAIVGEDEVLHQVRDALRAAEADRAIDGRLRRLFETGIATGRRARSRRSESSANLAQDAVAWLSAKTAMAGRPVVVAGAGRMGAALAHALAQGGARVTVASRDSGRASRLAAIYSGRGASLAEGARLTADAAAVAVALAGEWVELTSIPGHRLPPVADISSPQAVPDDVRRGMNGRFLGIDDLYRRGQAPPGAYREGAEALVNDQTESLCARLGRMR